MFRRNTVYRPATEATNITEFSISEHRQGFPMQGCLFDDYELFKKTLLKYYQFFNFIIFFL
ncbi:MAG: hypothetical protein LBU34_06735 [Planctomycetaceae bacterium]|nr:hypothetical protein [Planctomycetaceae bacterium]